MTADEFQTAWRVSADYQDHTAISALEDVAEKCGLTIYDQTKFADTLKQNVTVKLEDVSPLEVIEAICSQVNLHPRYRAGQIALTEGPRTLPVAFAGPFLIEVTQTHEYVPNAFAKVSFQCFAAGLPTAATSRLVGLYAGSDEAPDKITFQVPSLKGSDGSELNSKLRGFFPAEASKSTVEFGSVVEAVNLLRAVTSIAEFDGSISWSFPTKLQTVAVKSLEKGTVVEN